MSVARYAFLIRWPRGANEISNSNSNSNSNSTTKKIISRFLQSRMQCRGSRVPGTLQLLQQGGKIRRLLLDLLERTLAWRFVGPPSHQFRSMAEPFPGEMIVSDFDHEAGLERLPFARTGG